MPADENIGFISGLISEPSRAAILMALIDGTSRPATELAYLAGVTPQTASWHLAKLVEGNLLKLEKRGRHRFYEIVDPRVAEVLESLLVIVPKTPLMQRRLQNDASPLRQARTCYDHLAGKLGVKVTTSLLERGLLRKEKDAYSVVDENWFENLGIDLSCLRKLRRVMAKPCLDWTERKPHLGGALGAALLDQFISRKWISRAKGSRLLKCSQAGRENLLKLLDIEF